MANDRAQANYRIYILGTKTKTKSHLNISKLQYVFTIFLWLPSHSHSWFKHCTFCFFLFTLQDDWSRHMDTLLTTNGEAHIRVSFLYKLLVHRFSTHSLINHTRTYRYVHHRHTDFKTHTTMATLKTPLLYSRTLTQRLDDRSGTCRGHAAVNAVNDTG